MEYKVVNGTYQITDFDNVRKECQEFIDLVLQTQPTRKARTLIRKKKDEIATLRKEGSKAILFDFTTACKELEEMLGKVDDELTEKLNADKPPKPVMPYEINVKIPDDQTLSMVTEYLTKLELSFKTKKKEAE